MKIKCEMINCEHNARFIVYNIGFETKVCIKHLIGFPFWKIRKNIQIKREFKRTGIDIKHPITWDLF